MTGTTANYGFSYPQGTDLVTNGAAAIQTLAEGVDTALYTTSSSLNPNLLINGHMQMWQRQTFVSGITTFGYYTADRWRTDLSSLGTWIQQRDTDVPTGQGFGYSLKMDNFVADAVPAAGDNLRIQQRVEGQNLQAVRKGTVSAKPLTLSFWVKTTTSGTMIVELEDVTNTRFCSGSVSTTANTWVYRTVTFPADASGTWPNSNALALQVNFWLGAGSNFTSGTLGTTWHTTTANRAVGQTNWAASTSNNVWITGTQLKVGSVDTPFEFEPIAATLAKCQRYYYKDPACFGTGLGITTIARFTGQHPVEMRASPAVSVTNTVQAFGGTGTWTATGATGTNYSDTRVVQLDLPCTGGPATAGLAAVRVWNTSPSGPIGTIALDAEL